MEFFRKGGRGGLDPIHNFEAHFCASRIKEFCVLNRGLWTLLGTFAKSLFKIWPFRVFLASLVFPLLVTKNKMCPTGSITSENKEGGVRPLREEFNN